MGPPQEGSIRRPIAPWANALTTELHLAPTKVQVHASKDDVQAVPSLCLKIVCVCVHAWLLIFDIIIIIIIIIALKIV